MKELNLFALPFNAMLSAKGYVWFWPKIAAALTSKHHWLIIAWRQLWHRG